MQASPPSVPAFEAVLADHGCPPLRRIALETVQINVGKRCNQACHHCHVDAGPKRTEVMTAATVDRIFALIERTPSVRTVDITGGAPELNPEFRRLVREARGRGLHVMDRCNLTVLFEPGQEDTAQFLADHEVEIVASLPCYTADNVDRQRGKGVFDRSMEALRLLNRFGYGNPGSGLRLDLVYNPGGPALPPAQDSLEARYKAELAQHFGIVFDRLFTITNMPISRFAHALERDGRYAEYMALLVNHFNPATVAGLMCRALVSVGWDGRLYDCDFNQMLDLPVPPAAAGANPTVFTVDSFADWTSVPVAVGAHCFGCTAGAGSSCGGALG